MAISVDPDETARDESSYMDLFFAQVSVSAYCFCCFFFREYRCPRTVNFLFFNCRDYEKLGHGHQNLLSVL